MKRWTAAILAAILLLSLAACRKAPEAPAEEEEPPAHTEPETPISSTEPIAAPEESEAAPAAPPESEEEAKMQLYLWHSEVLTTLHGENGEGAVTLSPTELVMMSGIQQADDAMNAYYENVFHKLWDLCEGEVMELSKEHKSPYSVVVDADLARLDSEMISVSRTVTIQNDDTGVHAVTYCGETFDCLTGGLLTADDFFAVPESEYMQRLAECVRRKISENPYHDQIYFAQWEDLAASALEKENFYVTEDAYVVFYQENQLGPSGAVFAIPWRELEDITA